MKILLKMCEISSSICSSPVGHLSVTFCPIGLHSLHQVSTIDDKTFKPDEKLILLYTLFIVNNFLTLDNQSKLYHQRV